jgi:multicomponent Na+:H+ antiporter subunit C
MNLLPVSQFQLFALVSVFLFCICLYGLIVHAHFLRKILALNIMGSSIFLFLVATAQRNRIDFPDPVPHAMALTGIVVAVSATAFALVLVRHLHAATGQTSLPEEDGDA